MTAFEFYLIGAYMVGFISGAGFALILSAGIYKIVKAAKAAKSE